MSGGIRFGIIAASLCLTAAMLWGAAGLAMLFLHWIGAHPGVAKALPLLPVFLLPLAAIVVQRRRGRAAL